MKQRKRAETVEKRKRDPIRKAGNKQDEIPPARNRSSRVRGGMCVYAKMKGRA
jgi:hypothetical protein